MASYIEGSLISGEQVAYSGSISKWSVAGLILLGALFGLGGIVALLGGAGSGALVALAIGALILLSAYLKITTTELAITNKRVIAKFGFISRQTVELNLGKVESIQVHQGIAGRVFNYGSLVISGGGNPQAPVPGISNPLGFRKAFNEMQDQQGAKPAV